MKFLTLLLCFPLVLFAAIEEHAFENTQQEKIYSTLIQELRCLVCQNQNLADSNASLAKDLRNKTYEMVKAGKTHQQITEFMTKRYGDFVLYKPPMRLSTLLLWLGPFVFLILAVVYLARFMINKSRSHNIPLPDDELSEARRFLDE